jgi:hypothetical protein
MATENDMWVRPYRGTELISPGVVGSVGECNMMIRLKQNCPESNLRFAKLSRYGREMKFGSNVQDGYKVSYSGGGGPGRALEAFWNGRRSFRTNRGYILQDLRPTDTLKTPLQGLQPQYSWQNKVQGIIKGSTTGTLFQPTNAAFVAKPGELPRGGLVPRVVPTGDTTSLQDIVYRGSGENPIDRAAGELYKKLFPQAPAAPKKP